MAEEVTLMNFRDNYVSSAKPNRVFASRSRLKLAASAYESFMFWSRPQPAGSTVVSAKLQVWNAEDWAGSVTLTAEMVAGTWSGSSLTWATKPSVVAPAYDPAHTVTKTGATKNTLWEIDVTTAMQRVADGQSWYGIRLSASGATVKNIYSSQAESQDLRPRLIVQWFEPPPVPENLTPNNGLVVTSAFPTLKYDFVELAGDAVLSAHQVQFGTIDLTNSLNPISFASPTWDSGWVNTTISEFPLAGTTYPGVPLKNPANYDALNPATDFVVWRVRARDDAGLQSDWSDPAYFTRVAKPTVALNGPSANGRVLMKNLVPNPSIETNTGFYSGARLTFTRDTTWAEKGSASLKCNVSDITAGQYLFPYQDTTQGPVNLRIGPAATGDYISTRVRVRAIKNVRVSFYFSTYNSSGASAGWSSATVAANMLAGTEQTFELDNVLIAGGTGVAAMLPIVAVNDYNNTPSASLYSTTGDVIQIDGFMVVNSGSAPLPAGSVPLTYFDGDTADTYENEYVWNGTAHASLSQHQDYPYVEDNTPPITWSVTGRTQVNYRVAIAKVTDPDTNLFNTGKKSGTVTSIDTGPDKLLKNQTDIYRLTLRVWDDMYRQASPDDPTVYVEVVRDFKYSPSTIVTIPTLVSATPESPWPWVLLEFTRATAPDFFTIIRDGDIIDTNIDPGSLWVSGTTYRYRDRTAPPRVSHTWQVVANVNGQDSWVSNSKTATAQPSFAWLMEPDGTNPIAILKSGSERAPVIEASAQSLQQFYQPVGGSAPVLISQYVAGYQGHVEGVLSDEAVSTVTARQMKNIFKGWQKKPGKELLLYMVDDVMRVVPYNMTYRPRAKSGNVVLYDVSFDFYQVDY